MEPLARKGQKVVVDIEAEVKSGGLVVFDSGGTEGMWMFKRYVYDNGLHQFLSINNHKEIPVIVMTKRPDMRKVVGVVF
jgi:SOS-response transcriptional repressor LexA